jgi:hypothetical protein
MFAITTPDVCRSLQLFPRLVVFVQSVFEVIEPRLDASEPVVFPACGFYLFPEQPRMG